ncbi:hypothetical protein PGH07_07755 [Sulfurovum sp. zt1-1]|uniref:Uncharacterized protein n=1 Tax=Sulfurovum zhangzhouensis TaxID=3019067 RepID=A0ABT7QZ69_9BACT|nr:hypothetical protein [Sulfurovum zhangzhouensis]MDM5272071.1 hypothetical protein [Sulfurovum zhangzhouensis]
MKMIQELLFWLVVITMPMRKWKYGEDGKYIHLLLGLVALILFIVLALLFNQREFNFVGLALYMVFAAGFVEFIQRAFLGGTNTDMAATLDAFWMWLGGTIPAYLIYLLGLIEFSFYS